MRKARLAVLASLALAAGGCVPERNGGSKPPTHPVLDQDYTAPFLGTWYGTASVTFAGSSQSFSAYQGITRADHNRLGVLQLCEGVDGVAGLDSPATFSLDPVTCPPIPETCGSVTVSYQSGTGQLQQGTLTFTFQGTASGCGTSYPFTLAFTGTLPTPVNEPPVAVVVPASAETDAGVPVSLDATGSTDPDGGPLAYAWTIAAKPAGSTPSLTGAATATPTFSSDVPGSYRLSLVVTAQDGQTGTALVPILVKPVAGAQSWVFLESDPGDWVGQGLTYFYTKADAALTLTASGRTLAVAVSGDQTWDGWFVEPSGHAQLDPGLYSGLGRYLFDAPDGALDWSGEARGCNALTGWFAIDAITYSGTAVATLDLRFEQHCEGAAPALHGRIHWNAADPTQPPGPVVPPPDGLWRAPAGATPASGSYVYLESEPADWVGAGGTYLYTQADAVLRVDAYDPRVEIGIQGSKSWRGDFVPMSGLAALAPGYYPDVERWPFQNPTGGGLDWSGDGRACNRLTGWFAVDGVTYSGGAVTALDLRFEQTCLDLPIMNGALRGQIHWDASDPTRPAGPVSPPPADLWRAPAGAVPASGTYVYLESDAGDWVGQGQTYLYTQADAILSVSAFDNRVGLYLRGDQSWSGNFQAMYTLARLEPGYYGDVGRWPQQNPARGALDWSGEGRGCGGITGWFAVDAIAYSGDTVVGFDLRFEQHCEGNAPALRGQIHWDASDPTQPPGPVNPPPAGLWQPAPGTTPASGTYVYLESEPGDWVGRGGTYLYTLADAVLGLAASGNRVHVSVDGDEWWYGDFQGMSSIAQLEPGYYGDLERYPFHNPARGGLDWWGPGGCNVLTGWFAVDGVAYSGGTIAALDLRFEQTCLDLPSMNGALRGQIHWDASDPTQPPGPVVPVPAALWQPAPGATPASGNYVYLESQPGDFVGGGQRMLYTDADTALGFTVNGPLLEVSAIQGDWVHWWNGFFEAMNVLTRLEVGYYPDVERWGFQNPTRGGLVWSGDGRGCSALTGWFAVDGVAYAGSSLAAIDLRFEQICQDLPGTTAALHGQLRWTAP